MTTEPTPGTGGGTHQCRRRWRGSKKVECRAATVYSASAANAGRAVNVFIVDDHSNVRHGLRSYLSVAGEIDVLGDAGDGAYAVAEITALISAGRPPDVCAGRLVMPDFYGIEAAPCEWQRRGAAPARRALLGAQCGVVENEAGGPCARVG